jgi:hypothetical protein
MQTVQFTYSKGGDYEVYESGAYPARLIKWEDVGISPNAKFDNPQPQIRLDWQLLDENGQPTDARVSSWVNQFFTERAKLTDVVRALLGGEISEGFRLEMDELVGKECVLMLSINQAGTRNKIDSYAPIRRGPPAARPRAAQPAAAVGSLDKVPF